MAGNRAWGNATRPTGPTDNGRRWLRTRRNYPLEPHKFVWPIVESLRMSAELCDAIARELDSSRWREAADALDECALLLWRFAR